MCQGIEQALDATREFRDTVQAHDRQRALRLVQLGTRFGEQYRILLAGVFLQQLCSSSQRQPDFVLDPGQGANIRFKVQDSRSTGENLTL